MPSQSTPCCPLPRHYCNCHITGQTVSLDYKLLRCRNTILYFVLILFSTTCLTSSEGSVFGKWAWWMTMLKRSHGTGFLKIELLIYLYSEIEHKELGKSLSNQKKLHKTKTNKQINKNKRQNQGLKRQGCQFISGSTLKWQILVRMTPLPITKGVRSFHVWSLHPFLLSPGDSSMPRLLSSIKVGI